MKKDHPLLKRRITPKPISGEESLADLVDISFFAFNSARLREACVLGEKQLGKPDVTIGLTLAGAMTPAGLGVSVLVPMIESGWIDYLVSTGANLYHDIHYALNYPLYQSHPNHDDIQLRNDLIIRIYDILFPADVLYNTDAFVRDLLKAKHFQKVMGTREFHYLLGSAIDQIEKHLGTAGTSILAACYRRGVPVYTSSPGDSTFGLNLAAMSLKGSSQCIIDPSIDVNETSAIVWGAQQRNGKSGVIIVGGGSPKNFILQTEPHLIEILGLPARGHDYFVQFTDSRVDTGGLSGATPSEALSWGKIDPEGLARTVVAYVDSTIALPIFASYVLKRVGKKPFKEVCNRLPDLMEKLRRDSEKHSPPTLTHPLTEKIVMD